MEGFMGTELLDYTAILADLEAKKSALEQAIASFRQAMASGALGQMAEGGIVPSLAGTSFSGGEVPAGAFLGKSIPEAAKLYLEIVKKKQTTREIGEALQKGGMESTTKKNWLPIVHAALVRARKSGALVKVGNQWGLTGWYPKGIVTAPTEHSKKGKQKAKSAKKAGVTTVTSEVKTVSQAVPITDKKKGGAAERISQILQSKPGGEFTAQQIAEQASLNVQVAYMMLARLAKQGKANKTPSGAYRAIGPQALHAVM